MKSWLVQSLTLFTCMIKLSFHEVLLQIVLQSLGIIFIVPMMCFSRISSFGNKFAEFRQHREERIVWFLHSLPLSWPMQWYLNSTCFLPSLRLVKLFWRHHIMFWYIFLNFSFSGGRSHGFGKCYVCHSGRESSWPKAVWNLSTGETGGIYSRKSCS